MKKTLEVQKGIFSLLLIASIFLAVLVYSIKEISNEKKKKYTNK